MYESKGRTLRPFTLRSSLNRTDSFRLTVEWNEAFTQATLEQHRKLEEID
jgi:hypothetical protein